MKSKHLFYRRKIINSVENTIAKNQFLNLIIVNPINAQPINFSRRFQLTLGVQARRPSLFVIISQKRKSISLLLVEEACGV
jgi:hypothetical protein